jgi:hypothetical protein
MEKKGSYCMRQGDVTDTFKIAEILLKDRRFNTQSHRMMLRFAGDKEPKKLISFLDEYAAVMPRTLLRGTIEKLPAVKKKYYMDLKK